MIFVKLGNLLAWTLLILGIVRAGIGWFVAFTFTDPTEFAAAQARYIGSGTTGQAVEQGLMWAAIGIVIGLLVRIAEREPR